MNDGTLHSLARHRAILDELGDREPTTIHEAQAILEDIRSGKGYLDQETLHHLSTMPARSRQQIERIVNTKKETEAAYTKSISEQLYSSKYRFLYEIIQNADDSLYDNARRTSKRVYLAFNITPQEFVIETNEDGFTRANVEAICATGKSSKPSGANDFIGEKGFGFKSVFSVADKVHIQSGVWSFCFQHERDGDGLGMVTPLDAPPVSLPKDIVTRISLTLSTAARRDYQRLLDAVADLPETTLLFLQKLEEIVISTVQESEQVKTLRICKRRRPSESKVIITRTVTQGQDSGHDTELIEDHTFYVFQHTITQMPEDNRRMGLTSAIVDLAFPIHEATEEPKISEVGQHVFAFLPLERLPQLQFLIQSDFITSASRESVIDCDWNDVIREGVAEAFARAVTLFATPNNPLRYSWLDYLPIKPMDRLWKTLYLEIKRRLVLLPILQTWESRRFVLPSKVRQVPPLFLHDKQPIFRDLSRDNEIYLAPDYHTRHHEVLKDLDARTLDFGKFIDRLAADLISLLPRLYSTAPDESWHESCAQALLRGFKWGNMQARIKKLAIIPLLGAGWTGAPGFAAGGVAELFFPTTNGVRIPETLSLMLVKHDAVSHPLRRKLFENMGVKHCEKEVVLRRIISVHQQGRPKFSIPDVVSEFRYLFHFHEKPQLLKEHVQVLVWLKAIMPTSASLFFRSDKEYDTDQLLPGHSNKGTAFFVSNHLVGAEEPNVRSNGLLWLEWLQQVTGARYHPPLIANHFDGQLSPTILAVLERSPQKFVGLLQAHWSAEYEQVVLEHPKIRSMLADCKVECESGLTAPLKSTYLPFDEVRTRIKRFGVESVFPLLHLPSELDKGSVRRWHFLEEFGVHVRPELDLDFYMLVLEKMTAKDPQSIDLPNIIEVYSAMAEIIRAPQREKLREFFKTHKAVYYVGTYGWKWEVPETCVWDGPEFLTTNCPLRFTFGQNTHLEAFFREVLRVHNAEYGDILTQLIHFSNCKLKDHKKDIDATGMYKYIYHKARSDADWYRIRSAFLANSLVYANEKWHRLSSCVWESPSRLSGYIELKPSFPDLENFFVLRLGVKNATADMLVDDLIEMIKKDDKDIEGIRKQLLTIGRIAKKEKMDGDFSEALERLQKVAFLPMKKDNAVILVGIEYPFAISDHDRFGTAFKNCDILLDFNPAETSILDPIFQHLDLTDRYLSAAVEEVSDVGGDVEESQLLAEPLRQKAYALYCCAAKSKSVLALSGETTLYDQLSELQVFTASIFTTKLILDLGLGPGGDESTFEVKSDKTLNIDYEVVDGVIQLFLPEQRTNREKCYRNQLPELLSKIMDAAGAEYRICRILDTEWQDLDQLLVELDIADVTWITKPTFAPIESAALETDDSASERHSLNDIIREESVATASYSYRRSYTPRVRTVSVELPPPSVGLYAENTPGVRTVSVEIPPPSVELYAELLEQVIKFAHWSVDDDQTMPDHQYFDHAETFGDYETQRAYHNNRIGAAGELYVFEVLSALKLANFDLNNWQSGIRAHVNVHSKYSLLRNAREVEGADIIYQDEDGQFTEYLRENCEANMPESITQDLEEFEPIRYHIEVKSTPSNYTNPFFMSHEQYKRMEKFRILRRRPTKVYVICRVFNLSSDYINMKIYVDPWRHRDDLLDFHTGKWDVTPR